MESLMFVKDTQDGEFQIQLQVQEFLRYLVEIHQQESSIDSEIRSHQLIFNHKTQM